MQKKRSAGMDALIENSIGHDICGHSQQAIERGQRQPKNSEKPDVLPDAIPLRISHYQSCNFFSAPAAKTLIGLYPGAAFIAKHKFLPAELPLHNIRTVARSRSNKTPTVRGWLIGPARAGLSHKRKGHPATWAAFSFKGE
jgi:hypothetical protein